MPPRDTASDALRTATVLVVGRDRSARPGPAGDWLSRAGGAVSEIEEGTLALFGSVAAALDAALASQREARRGGSAGRCLGLSHGDVAEGALEADAGPVAAARELASGAHPGQVLATDVVRQLAGAGYAFVASGTTSGDPGPAWELRGTAVSPLPLPEALRAAKREWSFLGRGRELAAIAASLHEATAGSRQMALIAGEPGIGKTRLVAEAALEAREAGAAVLYGRGDEADEIPYAPFVEALGHLAEHASPEVLDALGDELTELARLLGPVRRRRPDIEVPPRAENVPDERYRLFGAVTSLLGAASAAAPLLLILEDLHWADRPSVLLLRHLLAAPSLQSTLILATYRDTDLSDDHALAEALADLRRDGRVRQLELAGLEQGDVAALMAELAGHELSEDEVATARRLHLDTSGNPLFVTEVMSSLLESESERSSPPGTSATVRDVILRRVIRLGPQAVDALGAAAVVGTEFDFALLTQILDLEADRLRALLDAAERSGLVAEKTHSPGRFYFVHALIARTLYDDQGAAGRGARHRRVAEALDRLGSRPGRESELARHWTAASPPDPVRGLECSERAGRAALDQLEPHAAERWFRRALALHSELGGAEDGARCDLLTGLGIAERNQGEPRFRDTLLEASRLAATFGDPDRLVAAALANTRGFVSASGVLDDERIAVLDGALEVTGDDTPGRRAELLATLAAELTFSGERTWRVVLSDESLSLARRLYDRRTLCHVLNARFTAVWMPDTLEERLANTREAVAVADELGDPLEQFYAVHWRGVALVQAGNVSEGFAAMARQDHLAARLGDPTALWISGYDRANVAIILGRLEEAEHLAEDAFQVATEAGQPDALPFYVNQLANIRYEQGRLPELQELVAEAVAENPGIPAFRALLAVAYAQGELLGEAHALLCADGEDGFKALPEDVTWLAGRVLYAHVAADTGEGEVASTLLEQLAPWGEQIAFTGISAWGDVNHALGRLASTLGEFERAEAHLGSAADRYRRLGTPIWQARAALDGARVCLARGAQGDRARAGQLLEAARTQAHALGAAAVERQAASLSAHERAVAVLGATGTAVPASPTPAPRRAGDQRGGEASDQAPPVARAGKRRAALRREGEVWVLVNSERERHLRDSKGLRYLVRLLSEPGCEVHVADLQGGTAISQTGAVPEGLTLRSVRADDAGELLDPQAKSSYRLRLEELREEVEEAERFHDTERAARAREELDSVAAELAAAVGLGGRDRKASSASERARVNVTRALKTAIGRIAEVDEGLGRHLDRSVRTGTFCAYDPSPTDHPTWDLDP